MLSQVLEPGAHAGTVSLGFHRTHVVLKPHDYHSLVAVDSGQVQGAIEAADLQVELHVDGGRLPESVALLVSIELKVVAKGGDAVGMLREHGGVVGGILRSNGDLKLAVDLLDLIELHVAGSGAEVAHPLQNLGMELLEKLDLAVH